MSPIDGAVKNFPPESPASLLNRRPIVELADTGRCGR
jgi:hypothetical protein